MIKLTYSNEVVHHMKGYDANEAESFNWLVLNKYREILACIDAIHGDTKAFEFLEYGKHVALMAFVNAIWDDPNAIGILIRTGNADWAACANIVNGDDKALTILQIQRKTQFIALAHQLQKRIRMEGDRNSSPLSFFKNMMPKRK